MSSRPFTPLRSYRFRGFRRHRRRSALVGLLSLAACTGSSDPPTSTVDEELYSDVSGVGHFNGVEWQIDAPWRLEPLPGASAAYDRVPLVITFHDARGQDPQFRTPLPISRFCGLYVVENGEVTLIRPTEFHEIEGSKRWLINGGITPGPDSHIVRRVWQGESPEDASKIDDWADWNATAFYQPRTPSPGHDLDLIVMARVSRGLSCAQNLELTQDEVLWQLMRGRVSQRFNVGIPGPDGPISADAAEYYFGDFLAVHMGPAPLPRFDDRWVYGDLHYHSQGTDNEGESGIGYRGVLQAMKAMGMDYTFATEHASNSHKITGIARVFITHFPQPIVPEVIVDLLLGLVREKGYGFPIPLADELRDMSPERFAHLYDWLNLPGGANAEVQSSGGSARAPQIFVGGEIDVAPEISSVEAAQGWFRYAFDRVYEWSKACIQVPDLVTNNSTFQLTCQGHLLYDGSTPDQFSLWDPQGLGQVEPSRQHMVYLPYTSSAPGAVSGRDAFIASNTSMFGGGTRFLGSLLDTELAQAKKGYVFLAHPVDAASGNDIGRLGPDMVPYSDTQLRTAFRSPYVLGLQLWNQDTRSETTAGARTFPMLHGQGTPDPGNEPAVNVSFDWGWQRSSLAETPVSLGRGTQMWDQLLRWGITPSLTADLPWLGSGAPRKVFMAGGSDAHGDLNYRREGRFTGWGAANDTAIGKPRNLTFVGNGFTSGTPVGQNQVIDGLRSGQFSVTDGPAVRIAVDINHNGIIDDADVPMGGDVAAQLGTVPVLVEWKSTPEFGPVERIDFYIGAQAGTHEGLVYAPAGHGTTGSGTCIGDTTITDVTGHVVCPMNDGYVRDPNGALRLTVASAEGMAGVRALTLRPSDYPVFDKSCVVEVETDRNDDGTEIVRSIKRCQVTNLAYPQRLYARAFAQTAATVRSARRYSYTNPIWMTAAPVASPPTIALAHQGCSGNVNTFTAAVTAGVLPGTIASEFRVEPNAQWQALTGPSFTAPGGQTVHVRARACLDSGCSEYATALHLGPTCIPPPPSPPQVSVEHTRCSRGTNSFLASIYPQGSIPATSFVAEAKVGVGGAWFALPASGVVTAGSSQTVSVRAKACSASGCSSYGTGSATGPVCRVTGGGGGAQ